jgi:hypothetical protein
MEIYDDSATQQGESLRSGDRTLQYIGDDLFFTFLFMSTLAYVFITMIGLMKLNFAKQNCASVRYGPYPIGKYNSIELFVLTC